jgi:hypothetical protein
LTIEPPIAKSTLAPVVIPVATTEPPIRIRLPELITVGKPPSFAAHLPPIVSDPGQIPGVTPLPEQTAEPPIRKETTASRGPAPE